TRSLSRIALGLQEYLYLGNMDALRDWGHAKDYVRMQWMMLQQDTAKDFVIASGEQHSVREFVETAAQELGFEIAWSGRGEKEVGVVSAVNTDDLALCPGQQIVAVDPRYFRPTEVETLLGDPAKAKAELGWEPHISFSELVREMIQKDLGIAQRDKLCADAGFAVCSYHE
ncbi:MAG: NAD-dependent epimerase/dehydratase family protein, partial [Candidatus Electrothrix sp. MAN1_4]|nr:NAD-dependent epimerase/dehydratase family protein [Candidatus Electrothrix sp. MAN1_4]